MEPGMTFTVGEYSSCHCEEQQAKTAIMPLAIAYHCKLVNLHAHPCKVVEVSIAWFSNFIGTWI
jgi:hypothetical protein